MVAMAVVASGRRKILPLVQRLRMDAPFVFVILISVGILNSAIRSARCAFCARVCDVQGID